MGIQHSEEFYHSYGICKKCGVSAGPFIPLKLVDEISMYGCIGEVKK